MWVLQVKTAQAPTIEQYPEMDNHFARTGKMVFIEGNSVLAVSIPHFTPYLASYGVLGVQAYLANPLLEKLAICESGLNPLAIGDKGTSFGLFQYKKATWNTFCEGDIMNPTDQIKCASKMLENELGKQHWKNCWGKIK